VIKTALQLPRWKRRCHQLNDVLALQRHGTLVAVLAALLVGFHDTRAIQGWLGHRSITSTAVYTALAPNRFEDFWRE
jgi:site-specific recombinase XerC